MRFWFKLIGAGHSVLLAVNAFLLAVIAVLAYRMLARLGSSVSAGLWLCFSLPVFMFAHTFGIANYNFMSPYSHEMTHGLLLALLGLGLSMRVEPATTERKRDLLAVGAVLGLSFLTKAEVFAATAAGIAVILGGGLLAARSPVNRWRRVAMLVMGGAVVAPLIALLLLSTAMPVGLAFHGVLGSWTGVFASEIAELEFYRRGMGTDQLGVNFGLMLEGLGVLAFVVAPALVLDWLLRLRERKSLSLVLAVATGVGTFWAWRDVGVEVSRLERPLPLVLAIAAVLIGVRVFRSNDSAKQRVLIHRLGFVVLALVLLAKMVLNTRFSHYGFMLCAPAIAAVFLITITWLPTWIRVRGGSGLLVAAAALGVVSTVALDSWQRTIPMLARKNHEVSEGRDFMLMDTRGWYIARILEQIEARFAAEDQLLVLPEGIMVNYLSRRRTPAPFTNYMPPEVLLYGEAEILKAVQANPPAGVILVHKDTSEYGLPLFGQDYGVSLMDWVDANYEQSWIVPGGGQPLMAGTEFGMAILERKKR